MYLLRGLLGVFSTGMDQIQEQLARQGIRCVALQHTEGPSAAQWIVRHHHPGSGPVVLVGHSLGADKVIDLAKTLQKANVPVALLITLDAVTDDTIPGNVQLAVNYYRSGGIFGFVPVFRGVPLKTASGSVALRNINLSERPDLLEPGTNHFSIDNNRHVQRLIVEQILSLCPPETDPPAAIRAAATVSPSGP